MKNLGIVRRIDDLGRIVIPIELRKNLEIEIGTQLEIYTENSKIILKKYETKLCENCRHVIDEHDKFCKFCGKELR